MLSSHIDFFPLHASLFLAKTEKKVPCSDGFTNGGKMTEEKAVLATTGEQQRTHDE